MKLFVPCILLTACFAIMFRVNDYDVINAVVFLCVGMCGGYMMLVLKGAK